ncbi:DNA-binding MarR family transcriptional regulator [Antricoccus suffuscus]|uniref:DNA-binding MarR family transcriptional regulator n=1 Tax=Antricoccus suffuscus TaxID=1629062 RepID=A0A2T0Z8R5_9ACTN|nr:MarR family transcriptional regulator [Antricoccus suffuscus]PRZ32753.1 DNA-binding MarR family transcriptional regulator [Antricoccus suffuscus]
MTDLQDETCADLVQTLGQLVRTGRARSAKWGAEEDPESGIIISSPLFALLSILRNEGEMRMQTLAARVGSDMSVVSRQVGALEEAGCICRRADDQDRRVTMLSLSDYGRQRHAAGLSRRVAIFKTGLRNWSEEDATVLLTLVSRITKDLADITD